MKKIIPLILLTITLTLPNVGRACSISEEKKEVKLDFESKTIEEEMKGFIQSIANLSKISLKDDLKKLKIQAEKTKEKADQVLALKESFRAERKEKVVSKLTEIKKELDLLKGQEMKVMQETLLQLNASSQELLTLLAQRPAQKTNVAMEMGCTP